ncbi:UNVERIFIED_CONTAM: hypothetical protein GTU68_010672 [Idotea baltica]|nr:hypothetical protein [Idotea baltica]
MTTVIIDYDSGNLRSAEKSFQRASAEIDGGAVSVSSDPEAVRKADRVVLPGVGAFADCRSGLDAVPGMQLMATIGREFGETAGFNWIPGAVQKIVPADPALKIPHMGWNKLQVEQPHPVFAGVGGDDHAYFVHSYHLMPDNAAHRLASVDYGGEIVAAVGRDAMVGTQFHPEKSQTVGLHIIGNFLKWRP